MKVALEALLPLSLPDLGIPKLHLDSKLNTPVQGELEVGTENMESNVLHL